MKLNEEEGRGERERERETRRGAAMKQTNTERADLVEKEEGRGERERESGCRWLREGRWRRRRRQKKKKKATPGKKPRKQKRGDALLPLQTTRAFVLPPPGRGGCRASGGRIREREKERGGRGKGDGMKEPGTATLDSYNCSFLQIPEFLPGEPERSSVTPRGRFVSCLRASSRFFSSSVSL